MAVDQVEKRQKVARDATALAPNLMEALYNLDALRARRDSGGPGGTPLAFLDSDFFRTAGPEACRQGNDRRHVCSDPDIARGLQKSELRRRI